MPTAVSAGARFGRLTVIGDGQPYVRPNGKRERRLLAECDCGSSVQALPHRLVAGKHKSCGCLTAEVGRASLVALRAKSSPPQEWCVDGGLATATIRGVTVTVDTTDVGRVASIRWCLSGKGYACTGRGPSYVLMHRLILDAMDGGNPRFGDHVNGDRTDNRRSNLRRASAGENARNSAKPRNSSRRYKGCCLKRGRYDASIVVNGRKTWLGSFATEEAAARAYDSAASRHFGPFARLNFPRTETCQVQ